MLQDEGAEPGGKSGQNSIPAPGVELAAAHTNYHQIPPQSKCQQRLPPSAYQEQSSLGPSSALQRPPSLDWTLRSGVSVLPDMAGARPLIWANDISPILPNL
ncbi:hypothetical protein NEUTE1DRAFT_142050 [Neurospora tetrasperma FGSC 2508]|uniref:Uncharacterized protein n=1 Tax=Neurospora tetrasperma (strain FGSC 2508 / ATCC MYA-4615 / P0657) TaxID=510951 RepID=F8N0A4_NEUT8|nr:uncharacterized protein NEUTE1DRAFT_142050 [Neurospora tetrasperma FGSC 2508]EGO52135.1 hypothetical protein NEUTE1DRAFT_142050 [Neurospora tetrasperma FGSC 2508]